MCGITGIYAFNDSGLEFFDNIQKSVDTLKQRGPNSNGIFTNPKCTLGHARLSVIDTSAAANQPFYDVTKRYVIVFNGEIYNFKELRQSLVKKGLPLKHQSDTEVLLYLYIIEGEKCLEKLNGFFAFAVYDQRDDVLFIARDRIGIKPLLYYHDRNKIMFASEMKALMALGIPKKIDKTSVSQYFQLNYIPTDNTIFTDVKKLSPGSYIKIEKGKLTQQSYYSIPYNRSKNTTLSYSQAQVELKKLISQSVQKRLVADVPIGAFLSGGTDSSIIVSEAVKYTDKLNTFSIGYTDEPFFDETNYAELVAKKFNTNHQTFKLTNNELFQNLRQVLEYIDEPFADSSALPLHILSMHTSKHATVALSGDGADELFTGYNKHSAHYNAIHKGFKHSIIKAGLPVWGAMPKSRNSYLSNKFRQLERYAKGAKLNAQERYWYWASINQIQYAESLLLMPASLNEQEQRKQLIVKNILKTETINDILIVDLNLVLVSDMLHKVDMMSMANSLEVRVPFLDHNLVAFACSLPDEYKINSQIRKRILQDAYSDTLPAELYNRPKHGFEVPLLNWFKTDLGEELFGHYLNPDFIQQQNIFNIKTINTLKQQLHSKKPGDIHARLWALLVFQHWWKKYMG